MALWQNMVVEELPGSAVDDIRGLDTWPSIPNVDRDYVRVDRSPKPDVVHGVRFIWMLIRGPADARKIGIMINRIQRPFRGNSMI